MRSVQAFARSQGFDLIVTDAVYASEAMDVTMAIVATAQPQGESDAE